MTEIYQLRESVGGGEAHSFPSPPRAPPLPAAAATVVSKTALSEKPNYSIIPPQLGKKVSLSTPLDNHYRSPSKSQLAEGP